MTTASRSSAAISKSASAGRDGAKTGGGGGGAATKMEGTDSTAIPSAVEAVAMLKRLDESEIVTAFTVVMGTVMVAVMSTLAAATRTVTRDASTLAILAIEAWIEDVSE